MVTITITSGVNVMIRKIGIVVGLIVSMQVTAHANDEFDQWMSQQSSDFASYQEKQDSEQPPHFGFVASSFLRPLTEV